MTDHEAARTLVKSPPELWAECSEAGSLARHLDGTFGEIKITRLKPETEIAWEGDSASGTVRIEPSAWGTRVTLTAQVEGNQMIAPEPEPEPQVMPSAPPPPLFHEPRGLLMRLRWRFAPSPPLPASMAPSSSEPTAPPPEAEPAASAAVDTASALNAALDSLGQAHHRPFSRG